jgi:hypothetical protein
MTRFVYGIDPGPQEHAIVVWDAHANRVVRYCNVSTVDAQEMLMRCVDDRDVVACEWVESYGMKVGQTVFQTVFQIGRIFAASPGVRLIPRLQIKMHHCHDSRAKDGNVRLALIDRFGEVGRKKSPGPLYGISNHLWSALAVAVYAAEVVPTEKEFVPDLSSRSWTVGV